MPDLIEVRPIRGYLTHAAEMPPESFIQRLGPRSVITYRRALCGVGGGGLRIRLDPDTYEPKPWVGVDGCDRCHNIVNRMKRA